MVTIRPYKTSDLENVRAVCHETARAARYKKDKLLVTTLYIDYYALEEPEHVFVVADDEDNAVGYIVASTDYKKYREVFLKKYASKIKKKYPFEYFGHVAEKLWMNKLSKTYPAHMHIDIIDSYQKGGYGRKLIDALFSRLKEEGIKGIRLGTSKDNKNAQGFYEHLGFKKLKTILGSEIIYGYLF